MSDYAIAFEFHDDVVVLNSSTSPTKARFYQVKTKGKGQWTLNGLTLRSKKKNSNEKLPSYMGKLFSNYLSFPDETEQLNFVSNATCEFLKPSETNCEFASCNSAVFQKFVAKLKADTRRQTQPRQCSSDVPADLSLHDSSAHLQGKLHNLVVQQIGSSSTILTHCTRASSKSVGRDLSTPGRSPASATCSSTRASRALKSRAGSTKSGVDERFPNSGRGRALSLKCQAWKAGARSRVDRISTTRCRRWKQGVKQRSRSDQKRGFSKGRLDRSAN